MPTCTVDLHQAVGTRCYVAADFTKMLGHCFKVDRWHNDPCTHAPRGAYGAEYIGPGVAAIAWCSRSAPAPGPDAGLRALLTNPGLVLPPDFQWFAECVGRQGSSDQAGKVFLCVSWAAMSCSGWNGRAVSLRKANLANNLPTLRS